MQIHNTMFNSYANKNGLEIQASNLRAYAKYNGRPHLSAFPVYMLFLIVIYLSMYMNSVFFFSYCIFFVVKVFTNLPVLYLLPVCNPRAQRKLTAVYVLFFSFVALIFFLIDESVLSLLFPPRI